MKFKAGDYIVWNYYGSKIYEKIIQINKKDRYYTYLDIETGLIDECVIDWLNKHARLMSDEEKAELL